MKLPTAVNFGAREGRVMGSCEEVGRYEGRKILLQVRAQHVAERVEGEVEGAKEALEKKFEIK